MKKYNCFKALFLSFYSADLYRDIAKNWGADTVFYIFMLAFLIIAPLTVHFQLTVNRHFDTQYDQNLGKFVNEFPAITFLGNGTIQTPENKPYLIHDPETGKVMGVIDTSGAYKTIAEQPLLFLVTKNQIIYRKKDNVIEVVELPKNLKNVTKTETLKPDDVKSFLRTLAGWIWITSPIIMLFYGIFYIIRAVFYAILGKIISFIMRTTLPYFVVLKLALVSQTPAIFLSLINAMYFSISGWWIFAVSIIYLIFAMYANKSEDNS